MSERMFEHAMLREIYEQPQAIERTLAAVCRGWRWSAQGELSVRLLQILRAAQGSGDCGQRIEPPRGAMAAEIMLEDSAGLAVDVEYASEYITRSTNTKREPAVLVISQSGETADTLAALREGRAPRPSGVGRDERRLRPPWRARRMLSLPTFAGVEKAIPATKSFTTQLVVLRLLSLLAAHARGAMMDGAAAARPCSKTGARSGADAGAAMRAGTSARVCLRTSTTARAR